MLPSQLWARRVRFDCLKRELMTKGQYRSELRGIPIGGYFVCPERETPGGFDLGDDYVQ
jgi:hypothetical protein